MMAPILRSSIRRYEHRRIRSEHPRKIRPAAREPVSDIDLKILLGIILLIPMCYDCIAESQISLTLMISIEVAMSSSLLLTVKCPSEHSQARHDRNSTVE